jgi:hypothetical protein
MSIQGIEAVSEALHAVAHRARDAVVMLFVALMLVPDSVKGMPRRRLRFS